MAGGRPGLGEGLAGLGVRQRRLAAAHLSTSAFGVSHLFFCCCYFLVGCFGSTTKKTR